MYRWCLKTVNQSNNLTRELLINNKRSKFYDLKKNIPETTHKNRLLPVVHFHFLEVFLDRFSYQKLKD